MKRTLAGLVIIALVASQITTTQADPPPQTPAEIAASLIAAELATIMASEPAGDPLTDAQAIIDAAQAKPGTFHENLGTALTSAALLLVDTSVSTAHLSLIEEYYADLDGRFLALDQMTIEESGTPATTNYDELSLKLEILTITKNEASTEQALAQQQLDSATSWYAIAFQHYQSTPHSLHDGPGWVALLACHYGRLASVKHNKRKQAANAAASKLIDEVENLLGILE